MNKIVTSSRFMKATNIFFKLLALQKWRRSAILCTVDSGSIIFIVFPFTTKNYIRPIYYACTSPVRLQVQPFWLPPLVQPAWYADPRGE